MLTSLTRRCASAPPRRSPPAARRSTQAGAFSLTVPDGADKVHLIFVDRTGDNMDHQAEYVVIDPVYDDLDVGTVYLP
jgi:hypothetical protein